MSNSRIRVNWCGILIFKSITQFCSRFVASWQHEIFQEKKNKICHMVGVFIACFLILFSQFYNVMES